MTSTTAAEAPVAAPEAPDTREDVAAVLAALVAAAERRDDPLLALAADALCAVHDLYAGYSPHAVASTPPVHARNDINATLAHSLRGDPARHAHAGALAPVTATA